MKNTIQVKDKTFAPFITADVIDKAVKEVAEKINKDMAGKNPLFLVVLNGAFMFASDLVKYVEGDCEISFVKLSSYSGTKSTHIVRELIGLDENVKGRNIIIVEDIIDTGITMAEVINKLGHLEAKEVKIATMLFKPDAFQKSYHVDYIGLEIPNDFIIGYGLDYDGYARNLKDIYKIVE